MRSGFETLMMLLVTGITNLCMVPAIMSLHKQEFVFEAFIGCFTMFTSSMYHVADSIDRPIWLTEGQWHRLDNIGSIMSFIIWGIYLMDIKDEKKKKYVQYFFLAVVLVLQEKNPWDDWNAYIPIALSFFCLMAIIAVRGKIPPYNYAILRRGMFLLAIGFGFFIKGLDDKNDPFRFFHGCWHAFVGAAAYVNFSVLPTPPGSASSSYRSNGGSHLPMKSI